MSMFKRIWGSPVPQFRVLMQHLEKRGPRIQPFDPAACCKTLYPGITTHYSLLTTHYLYLWKVDSSRLRLRLSCTNWKGVRTCKVSTVLNRNSILHADSFAMPSPRFYSKIVQMQTAVCFAMLLPNAILHAILNTRLFHMLIKNPFQILFFSYMQK